MADNTSGGPMGLLGVLIGAILVIGVGYFIFAGSGAVKPTIAHVTIEAPKAPAPAAPAAK